MSALSSQFIKGLTNPRGNLGDFAHASKLFVDADMRLAPKVKFLYYVSFIINTAALPNVSFKFKHQNEINMLVKRADLPKFTIATETLNQYNRKKVVQNKIDYNPVNISFHDDNLGVTRQLWENYFKYYYADPTAATDATSKYRRNAMKNSSTIMTPYGLDNNSTIPFFDKIVIYQMGKGAWNSYTLVNPLITAWNHDQMDYSANAPVENNMTVAYEAVSYASGQVSQNNPPGFASEHYDTMPSPLSVAGGGTRTLFGAGGVLAGASGVFGDLSSGKAFESPLNFISTAISAVNTYQNAKSLTKSGVTSELTGIAVKGMGAIASSGVSGVKNTAFPVQDTSSTTTVAKPRTL